MVCIKEIAQITQSYFWWPGMVGSIEQKVKMCSPCQNVSNVLQLAPLHPWNWPEDAWQCIYINFAGPFEDGMFLVFVNAHSRWPDVDLISSTTEEKTIEKLGELFSRLGTPL